MAKIDRHNLEKLLNFIDHIIDQEEDGWFKDELRSRVSLNNLSKHKDALSINLNELYEDVKRTKHFLKNIDKRDWLEGFKYYSKISNPELRIELIKDYREMKIAERSNDLVEFARRISLQIENCINYAIEMLDAYSIIKNNPSKFTNNYNNLLSGDFSFFYYKSGQYNERKISSISFISKVFFIETYYGFKVYWTGIHEINNYRNIASHRGSYDERQQKLLEELNNRPLIKKANMLNAFNGLINGLPIIRQ